MKCTTTYAHDSCRIGNSKDTQLGVVHASVGDNTRAWVPIFYSHSEWNLFFRSLMPVKNYGNKMLFGYNLK